MITNKLSQLLGRQNSVVPSNYMNGYNITGKDIKNRSNSLNTI